MVSGVRVPGDVALAIIFAILTAPHIPMAATRMMTTAARKTCGSMLPRCALSAAGKQNLRVGATVYPLLGYQLAHLLWELIRCEGLLQGRHVIEQSVRMGIGSPNMQDWQPRPLVADRLDQISIGDPERESKGPARTLSPHRMRQRHSVRLFEVC
jgi:hypothetical protein